MTAAEHRTSTGPRPDGDPGYSSIGRPLPCLLTGALMMAVPTVVALTSAAPGEEPLESSGGSGASLLATVVLIVGALAVAVTAARTDTGAMAALGVLCAVLALGLEPPEAWADAVCGLAALAFLLATRLHRQSARSKVNVVQWLAEHRAMAVGAGVVTPAALVAASVPGDWSLLVVALVGLACAALGAALFSG